MCTKADSSDDWMTSMFRDEIGSSAATIAEQTAPQPVAETQAQPVPDIVGDQASKRPVAKRSFSIVVRDMSDAFPLPGDKLPAVPTTAIKLPFSMPSRDVVTAFLKTTTSSLSKATSRIKGKRSIAKMICVATLSFAVGYYWRGPSAVSHNRNAAESVVVHPKKTDATAASKNESPDPKKTETVVAANNDGSNSATATHLRPSPFASNAPQTKAEVVAAR